MAEIIAEFLGLGSTLSDQLLLRALLASLTAFAATALFTRWLLSLLARLGVCERVDKTESEELKDLHKCKASTPTMGGIAMVAGFGAATLIWAPPSNPYIVTGLFLVL
ncbi:MAG: hypothetical protein ACYTFG_04025, partial [Planctomycetota bacterium]